MCLNALAILLPLPNPICYDIMTIGRSDGRPHRRIAVEPVSWEALGEKAYEKISRRYCYTRRTGDTRQRPTHLSATANEGLQHTGERDERRCSEAVYEHLLERWRGGNERAALHQGKAVRQFLHRHGQGLS